MKNSAVKQPSFLTALGGIGILGILALICGGAFIYSSFRDLFCKKEQGAP